MENEKIETAAAALVAALAANGEKMTAAEVERIAREIATKKTQALAAGLVPMIKKAAADALAAGGVRRVEVVQSSGVKIDVGVQHEKFEMLCKLCTARVGEFAPNIYLYGPAGSGKSTAAREIARALGLPFYSTGAVFSKYDLIGMVNGAGDYIESDFYKAYKNGGVFLFDELDISDGRAVKCFAQALANGHASFPTGKNGGGIVARHKDSIIIAGGNTDMRGGGAGGGYNTGVKQDSAIRDRFIYLYWGLDSKLEKAIAAAYGETGAAWVAFIQKCRENATAAGIRDFEITPRATLNGCALLSAGMDRASVVDMTVRKGINDEAWYKISRGAE